MEPLPGGGPPLRYKALAFSAPSARDHFVEQNAKSCHECGSSFMTAGHLLPIGRHHCRYCRHSVCIKCSSIVELTRLCRQCKGKNAPPPAVTIQWGLFAVPSSKILCVAFRGTKEKVKQQYTHAWTSVAPECMHMRVPAQNSHMPPRFFPDARLLPCSTTWLLTSNPNRQTSSGTWTPRTY